MSNGGRGHGRDKKVSKVGRNATTGRLTTTKKHPSTHTVERIPKQGKGDKGKKR